MQLLNRLWDATSLGKNPTDGSHIPFEVQNQRWRVLGFQGDDPTSDLRASGVLGLHALVYFAENYTGLFLHLAREQTQVSPDMYYPVATAGINITFLMTKLLGLSRQAMWCPSLSMHPLFFYKPCAWEELYTIITRFFDQKWKRMMVGYMGFQLVLDATEESISEYLNKRSVGTVPAIFDMLGILVEDLDSFRQASLQDVLPVLNTAPLRLKTKKKRSSNSPHSRVSRKKESRPSSPDGTSPRPQEKRRMASMTHAASDFHLDLNQIRNEVGDAAQRLVQTVRLPSRDGWKRRNSRTLRRSDSGGDLSLSGTPRFLSRSTTGESQTHLTEKIPDQRAQGETEEF